MPPVLSVTLSDVSLTVTVQGGLKTQLIAGALTLTTFSGAAVTTMGAKQSSKANENLFILCLPPEVDCTAASFSMKSSAAAQIRRLRARFELRGNEKAGALSQRPGSID